MLEERLQVPTLGLPELDLHHGPGVATLLQLLVALHAQHFVNLVRPLDDDPLDVVLHEEVDVLAVALPDLDLLVLDIIGRSLREGEEGLALDVTPDLVDGGLELVDLSLDVWTSSL